jgi:hypothetical protein
VRIAEASPAPEARLDRDAESAALDGSRGTIEEVMSTSVAEHGAVGCRRNDNAITSGPPDRLDDMEVRHRS